jgi:hypothetical protein
VSEENITSILRIEKAKQETSMKQVGSSSVFYPEDGEDMFLRNVCSLATEYMRDISSQNVILRPIFANYSDADLKQVCACRGQESSEAEQ